MTQLPRRDRYIELGLVHSGADVVAWLRRRAEEYRDASTEARSAGDVHALRRTSGTLDALATVLAVDRPDDNTVVDLLTELARSYREGASERASDQAPDHQQACGHLADTLGQVAFRLAQVDAVAQARRSWLGRYQQRDLHAPSL